MSRITNVSLIIFFLLQPIAAQEFVNDSTAIRHYNILHRMIQDGDTIPHSTINEVSVFPAPQFDRRRDLRRYERLVYNLKIVHPYAVMAAATLDRLNDSFSELKTDRERKQFVKKVEQELMDEFEDELKSLTITQGRLLIKLIDRETGNTSYELLKELRGSFSAFFWQTVARLFGSNLKTTFDAEGEDKLIDQIIVLIENGHI
jgi:hypothetical protein